MSRKSLFHVVSVIALLVLLAGCAAPTPQIVEKIVEKPVEKVVQQTVVVEKPVEKVVEKEKVVVATPIPAAKGVNGPFYFVQSSAWHPVHQLMQQSFLDGCAKNGLKCSLATTDENTLDALVAMADATVQRPDAKGFVFYAGGLPVFKPIIEKAKARNLPVALPHFPMPEGTFASNAVQIAADTTKYPDPVAKAMCEELKKQGLTKGSVAITENGHNATEDMVAKVFADSMKKYCPEFKVLDVVLEGGEPTQAIAAAVSIIQANPDIIAGFSTTGGGPTTWAGAQDQTGKKVLSVGMDYTRVNLDLVKAGKVWGIVAQPIYDEMAGAAVLLYKMANGEKVPYWTMLEAPLVTKANLDPYYAIFDKLEPQFRAAVNPDSLKPTPVVAKGVTGPFYFVQSSAWHPVHQLMQQSFLDGCAKNGLKCQLATTDENTLDALVAMADATVQRPDAKGFVFYAGGLPVFKPIIEKAKARNLPVALPHFPMPEGTFASNAVQIAADTSKYPDPVAKAMCDELKKQGKTKGSVAITENGHNATEDKVAEVFAAGMKKYCPEFKVLDVVLEGGEPTQAIAAAVSIIQANPDIIAGFSTTGGGPTTWAGAQDQTGKKVLSVGMDYTRVNLDLVKAGKVWGIVAQPIYDEMAGAAVLLYKMANGEKVPYWTMLEAPLVTKDNLDPYYEIFNKLEPQFRAAVNPDSLRATPTPGK